MQAETIVMAAEPPIPASRRITIKLGMFGAKEHPRRKALKTMLEQLMTIGRPYNSDSGARIKGPIA
jgi:hypothetical protein